MTIDLGDRPLTLRDGLLDDLHRRQHGVASREQLTAAGITARTVEAQLRAERWTAPTSTVVTLTNGPLTRDQLLWVAVLSAPRPAALACSTALVHQGFRGLLEDDGLVHVVVARATMMAPVAGVRIHESRRFTADDVVVRRGLPTCSVERAAIDVVAWQRRPRFAYAVVGAVVQQRLGTVERLRAELDAAGHVRHRGHLRCAIDDVAGGAQALGEMDLVRACRRFGLQRPVAQRVRHDAHGRKRYLDAEWDLGPGRIVVLEVDGAHHREVEHWEADMRRERAIVVDGRTVLRCSSREIRLDPAAVITDLRGVGVPSA
ncbi:hypothetical protein [Solicola sp. PLA-1-18]|uniref:hypothetical protein n=1 Tax=Solicola sp. PLA-1-18 TaxID=3380532 RepID=UPI003B78A164